MATILKPKKCSECGKRRTPALRSRGRPSTKCRDCFGGIFWKSDFGRWFAEATTRQSPDSMPFDEDDIKGIYQLWKTRKSGKGFRVDKFGRVRLNFEYHICHRDPAKGDGFQGRFTTANLIVAPAKANKKAYNKAHIDHGYRVYTDKKPFGEPAKVRQWATGKYNLNSLVSELELKKYKAPTKSNTGNDFLPVGISPYAMVEEQFNRFKCGGDAPWSHTIASPNTKFQDAIVYGIGLGEGKLKKPEDLLKEVKPNFDF